MPFSRSISPQNAEIAEIIYFFFNCLRTSSAHSAVNYYVSFSIKLTVLLPGGRAQTLCSLQPNR